MAEPSFLQMLKTLFGGAATPAPAPPHPARPVSPVPAPPAPVPPATPPQLDLDRIPSAARERVTAIQTLVGDLQRGAAQRGLAGSATDELAQIEMLFLPRLLKSYAEIPAQHRAEIFRDTGRSASFLLVERLDRILERLNEISRDFARGHIDTFAKNMRFIDLRYGSADSPFD